MKSILFVLGAIFSGLSHGADWKFAAIGGENDRAIYVDNSQYAYDKKNNTIKAWFKTDSYKELEGNDIYTKSKDYYQFSCLDNKLRLLAFVNYGKDGNVISSAQREEKDAKYDLIIPDTTGENMWRVACLTKGKGFRFPKWQIGERLSKAEMEKILPKGYQNKSNLEESNELMRNLSAQ
ncbi:hypothetical protein NDN13_05150 [Acinetobacter sp. C32I]|uniref:surface-adhesin E family protein n=1 Tax=Acinetobacter sp. C32I TaxID=2950074 RepID=UPI002036701F|nr:surface-adhesin E family protein [Acinetobacter sp. C32I]USA54584.1 hypothetical protein NDN13_05150 [Acinetobacter sp. C32I]